MIGPASSDVATEAAATATIAPSSHMLRRKDASCERSSSTSPT